MNMRLSQWLRKKSNFVMYSTLLFGTIFAVGIVVAFGIAVPRIYYPAFVYVSLVMVVLAYVAGFVWGRLMWAFVIEPRLGTPPRR
jgi:hypothetical protein